ncbi:TlpA disulfide reductase family protein [Armatimonas sp.]|uniref:TlpA disulfide reductase family protein n=1 Tax=Armatimonas sp. TaxID=1872638 RepID=UPI0037539996
MLIGIIKEIYGYVILMYFWSSSCPSCHANMPHLQKIRDEYGPKGLQIVAVHRPMGEFDLDEAKVLEVAKELGITEKLIFDNDHSIGDELKVDAWPTYFLFDKEGKVRRHAKGQFGVRMIEQALIRLFDEDEAQVKEKSDEAVTESFPLSFAL